MMLYRFIYLQKNELDTNFGSTKMWVQAPKVLPSLHQLCYAVSTSNLQKACPTNQQCFLKKNNQQCRQLNLSNENTGCSWITT